MAKAVSGTPMIRDFRKPSPESVETAFQKLAKTAAKLNQTSDELTKLVERLDISLKKLNLGVSAWVDVVNKRDEDDNYHVEQLGYTKWGNKWGLAIRMMDGVLYDQENESRDTWLFTDAPRELRIRAVEHIQDLIAALDSAASQLASKVASKIDEVSVLAELIDGQIAGAK